MREGAGGDGGREGGLREETNEEGTERRRDGAREREEGGCERRRERARKRWNYGAREISRGDNGRRGTSKEVP